MHGPQFPDKLVLELLPQRRRSWREWLLRDFCGLRARRRRFLLLASYRFIRPNGQCVTIHPGVIVDAASIPWFFYRLIGPPWGPYAESSVIHDGLWARAEAGACTFRYANTIFLEAMTCQGLEPWRRWLMYRAVVLTGWVAQRLQRRRRRR